MERLLWASTQALGCGGKRDEAGLVGQLGEWLCRAALPPPRVCGAPGGPPVTVRRVRLRDGRHLAYEESGVPKEVARYRIIFSHGFAGSRLAGSCGGARRVHGGLRPRRLRRERPEPLPLRAERGAGHGGAGRRAGPGRQVLRRGRLPRLPRHVERAPLHPAQAGGRRHAGARGQLLVARAPRGPGGGGVRAAGARGPVGAARGAPRARAPPLVDGPALATHLHRRRQHHPPPQRARRRGPPRARRRRHAPAEAGGGHTAGRARVLPPRHGRHVRQVGVRPHGPAGAALPRAPVAGRRGRPRAGRPSAPRRRNPRVGQLPRAPRHRTLPVRRPWPRGHRSTDTLRFISRPGSVASTKYRIII
uniref:Alpha/beta-Hydrolases superfamily protein n=1 Tax=Zea mays TaxID=4577 RepID=A0A804RCC2_MAIZE